DKDLALLCVRAYNDWMVEEWCAGAGGRLIPLCLIPLWDAEMAAAEVRRNADRGVRAVAFSELPTYLGLPSIYGGTWDPFFAACEETGTVVCMHIGSGTKTPQASPDAPDAVAATILFGNSAASLVDLLYSGTLHRFPGLKFMYAEAQIGWIPYVLERADDVWTTHRGWSNSQRDCPEPPSTYYRRGNVTSCFFKDPVGVSLLDDVGVDNVVFETDYPHSDSTWPDSRQAAAEQFGHLDADSVRKIARGNAIRLLGLTLPAA
ncbi:MAG TPA: amidohydrolase family protein, partial [Acidimicrobiales bacterium]|nr:amidohydrolase family protein [Acidimicrobiales bacterium]